MKHIIFTLLFLSSSVSGESSVCFSDEEYSSLPETSKFFRAHNTYFMLLKVPMKFEGSELRSIGLHYGESAGPLNGNTSDTEFYAHLAWREIEGEAHLSLDFNKDAKPVVLEIIYSGCGHSYWCVVRKGNDSYKLDC